MTAPQPIETTTQSPLGEAVPAAAPSACSLSPLNQRRWQNFKANRRGYWSLWIFLVLFFVSLFAEFIANDQPVPDQATTASCYFPVFVNYPETKFGGVSRPPPTTAIPYLQKQIADKGWHCRLAADPLFLRHAQSRSADAGAVAADLDADRGAVQGGGAEEGPDELPRSRNTTGSAPTTRAATWSRA